MPLLRQLRSSLTRTTRFTTLRVNLTGVRIFRNEGKLFQTEYGKNGIRKVLLESNPRALKEVSELKAEFAKKQTSNVQAERKIKADFKERLNKIKNADYTPNVIIKASDKATYANLLQVLDEMQICSIGRYVIDNFVDGDKAKIEALKNGTAQ